MIVSLRVSTARTATHAENKSLREICNLRILEFKVVRFIPSFPAALAEIAGARTLPFMGVA